MMQGSLHSYVFGSARNTVSAGRYAVKLFDLNKNLSNFCTGSMSMITDGTSTSVAGHGDLFNNFLATKQLTGYIGNNDQISTIFDDNYKNARLKLVRFDQSFQHLSYDVRIRECIIFLFWLEITQLLGNLS